MSWKTHGEAGGDAGKGRSSEYGIWAAMMARCRNPRHAKYVYYGGRGIQVCDRWLSFINFLADMGRRPSPDHSIDRINNDKGYEPENVRWATAIEQQRNTRNNRLFTIDGQTCCLTEWCQRYSISQQTFVRRVNRGMLPLEALANPVLRRPKRIIFPPNGAAQCKQLGINRNTVHSRMSRGWTFERALAEPVGRASRGKRTVAVARP